MRSVVLLLLGLICLSTEAKPKLVLVTIDGLRWQEVFRGGDPALVTHKNFVKQPEVLQQAFMPGNMQQNREALMPFFWHTLAKKGSIIGNRDEGSLMSVANPWYFSYPGYSEIFTGVVDQSLNSNAKVNNPQTSFLEWLNNKPEYGHKLAAFGSWDVFPYIFNRQRSQLHINAGFESAGGYELSAEMQQLNQLQKDIPSPWHSVRLDAFTHRFALDYLTRVKPDAMVIAYGETDDFAHDGRYDEYLKAARRTDRFIAELWQTLQGMPGYRNNTILMVTTDHGRGSHPEDWQHHASLRSLQGYMQKLKHFKQGIVGSEHIWFAAMGPGVESQGLVKTTTELKQQQIAATALTLMGYQKQDFNPKAADPMKEVIQP